MTSPESDSSYAYTPAGLYLGPDGISMRFVEGESSPWGEVKVFACNKLKVGKSPHPISCITKVFLYHEKYPVYLGVLMM